MLAHFVQETVKAALEISFRQIGCDPTRSDIGQIRSLVGAQVVADIFDAKCHDPVRFSGNYLVGADIVGQIVQHVSQEKDLEHAQTEIDRVFQSRSLSFLAYPFILLETENPESVYLVDVRDADEYKKGTLKTAVNIPVDDLENKIKELPSDKPIIFICGTGARSGESFYMVQDLRPELKKVFYLDGELTIKKDGSFTLKKPI